MKFLVDAQLPRRLSLQLRALGHGFADHVFIEIDREALRFHF
ncbi:MAG: hypothetical protein KatS3mg042_1531 [Rhodothermaceae bacterium]|nr:MAG: hypothetical protein KatS3mg042_1531 [Rhodothermaceae bacterium]